MRLELKLTKFVYWMQIRMKTLCLFRSRSVCWGSTKSLRDIGNCWSGVLWQREQSNFRLDSIVYGT